jgi:hypothetical protein
MKDKAHKEICCLNRLDSKWLIQKRLIQKKFDLEEV